MADQVSPRLIVPDLARGTALLGIAMANAAQAWMINSYSAELNPGWSVGGVREGSVIDAICAVFAAMFVHVRGLPMFSTLLGFGFGLVASSLARKGYTTKESRRVLIRRYGILALFGLAHLFLIFYGDIMFTYGVIGVAMALLFTLSTKKLRIIAYTLLGLWTAFTGFAATVSFFIPEGVEVGFNSSTDTSELNTVGVWFAENLSEAITSLAASPMAVLQLGALSLIGFIWARERVLIDVSEHRRTLTTWTVLAAAIIVLLGVPWGLSAAGVLPNRWETAFFMLNQSLGYWTGPGILAALALATDSLHNEVPGWAKAFVALGKRSMSGYLAQSFLFIALVMPFTLGLGRDATVSGKLLMGLVVWLITLLLAVVLDKADKQGPFEQAHRRLAYGKTGRIEPKHDRAQIAA